jgi:uncharacterized damage-inducible protein DinB
MEGPMATENTSFSLLLKEGFSKAAWHGPNLLGSLKGLSLDELLYRPTDGVHNIWELALHCAYWKWAVRHRLVANSPKERFPLKGRNFFPRHEGLTRAAWKRDLSILKEQHRALEKAVRGLDPKRYGAPVAGRRNTVRRIVLGIAAHDIYHAGQVSLLKRLATIE